MKNFKKFCIICIGMFLILLSCEMGNNANDEPLFTRSSYDFSYFGDAHNNLLDYVTGIQNFDTVSRQTVFEYAENYSDNYFEKDDHDWQDNEDDFELILYLIENPDDFCDTLSTLGYFTSTEKSLCESLLDAMDQTNLNDIISDINTLMESIERNHTVLFDTSTNEGNYAARFLVACEISKSSLEYWEDVSTDPNHNWYYRFYNVIDFSQLQAGNELEKRIKWPRWIKVAAADIGGFFSAPCTEVVGGTRVTDLECCWDYACDKSDSVP